MQKMIMRFFNKVVLISFSFITLCSGLSSSNFSQIEKSSVAFFSTIEQKKKLLEKLQLDQAECQKKTTGELSLLRDEIIKIDHQMSGAKQSLKYLRSEQEAALKNKKITTLDEIKQVLSNTQEELKESVDILELHAKIIKEYIAIQNKFETDTRAAYSWQELREAQLRSAELTAKFETERKNRDYIAKQKNSETEAIASLQKRLEVQSKEHLKNASESRHSDYSSSGLQLKLSNELFDLETLLLQKKIELAKAKIAKLELQFGAKNDEVELLDIQTQNQKQFLARVEKGLSITTYDVENARAEANLANHNTVHIKESFNKKIDDKKSERTRINTLRSTLEKQIKDLSGGIDSVEYHVLKSEDRKYLNVLHVIEREIDFLSIKRELADLTVQNKEITAQDVDVRYKLSRGQANASELVHTFRNQQDIAQSHFKKIKAKHDEVMKSYSDRSRALEEIKATESKINARSSSIFIDNEREFRLVHQNLGESKKLITTWFSLSQEYIAISSDYLNRYERILRQYDLIIDNLENHRTLFGLWKRAPNALTIDDLVKAFGESEIFIKQLFFETPKHLSLSKFINAIKTLTWQHALNILVLILFFITFMMSLHFFSKFLIEWLRKVHRINHNDKILLYATIGLGALQFLQDKIIWASAWLFFYLHIIFHFKGPFTLLQPYALPYFISLFYIASIPLFIYLARNLLIRLKELNKKISFLSFPENFQERIELLLAAYSYTFAILVPLRQAAWHLLPHSSLALVQFLHALQVSTLILIPVFIFNKEHVLYFLPSNSSIGVWIKKQIDNYYYPLISFVVMLFMLSRSFVGYGNLATFLSFSIPLTILVFYGMFWAHFYMRKYAVFIFMRESDEEISDKFEHAKTYYGFFVIFSFLLLLFLSAFIIARIWEFNVSINDFWRFLSETLVVRIGVDKRLGFMQLMTLFLFVAGGFFASSITHRFVLNRLFDILRTEPGTQNTVTKLVHYFTICLSILLGFISIHLDQLIWYIGTTLAVGLGFALKDILTDYVAGFFVLIERPIEIGNYVRLENNPEMQGVVHKIDARTTTIMTRLNHSLIIANKDIVTKLVSNWGKGRFAVGFEIKIMVAYESNIDEVKKTIQEVLQSNPVILRVPNIIIRLDDFADDGLYFLARAFISARRVQEQWIIASNLREELLKAFKAKNIQFGFPQRHIYFDKQGESRSPVQFNFDQ